MLLPENVVVPVPALAKLPAPDITPLNVVLVLSAPAVSVNPLPSAMLPAPAIEPTVSLLPTL